MRVVIGEDEALLRTGLTHVMQAAGFDVVAAVGDAHELVRSAGEHVPDIVVTDIRMPPDHQDAGLRAAMEIRREHPGIAVLVLSQHLSAATPPDCWGIARRVSGTSSSRGSPTSTRSPTTSAASLSAAPSSTPRWWASWSPPPGGTAGRSTG